jgi:hypothetical protein
MGLAGPAIIGLVALLLSAAWGWLGSSTYQRGLSRLDDRQLERASAVWNDSTKEALGALEREVRVLVDDARIRQPLTVPQIDDTTLLDLLSEIQDASRASIVGIVTPEGKVRVIRGADSMRGLDLSGSSLMKADDDGIGSLTWALQDRLVAVALAPIRLGETLAGYLVFGREIGRAHLSLVHKATGADGAVVVQRELVTSTELDEATKNTIKDAIELEPDRNVVVKGDRVVRTMRIDEKRGGKVVWVVPRHHEKSTVGIGSALWWAPSGLVLVGLLSAMGLEFRRGKSTRRGN